jgi:hypothetical protein
MKYLEQFYGPKFLTRMRSLIQDMEVPSGVPYFLVGEDQGAKFGQIELNRYVEVVLRHGAMDRSLENRWL